MTAEIIAALRDLDDCPPEYLNTPCPQCGEHLLGYHRVIQWRYYPDHTHYEVHCENCDLFEEVDI